VFAPYSGKVTSASERPEWTPGFLRTARVAATRAVSDRATDDADKIALAVRELAAEVRALRHQLAGMDDGSARHGVLRELEAAIDLARRRGQ
jgi:hypothetical protein